MNLFHMIDEATAIIRKPNGVFAQVKMYHRGDRLFVAHGGGFLRITAKFGGEWGTSHPSVKVVEFDCPHATGASEPRYQPEPTRLRAAA